MRRRTVLFAGAAAGFPGAAETRKSRLMTLGWDGAESRLVHETADRIEAPNWSADGKWLVFNAGGGLFKVPAEGGAPPQAIDLGGIAGANNDHVLAPDGKSIYFSARGHIYAVPFAGGAPRRVSNEHPGDEKLVYWLHGVSPDGKTLAHCGDRKGNKDIWLILAVGGESLQVTKDERANWFPHPSPDGKCIVYLSYPPGTEGHPADRDVILRRMTPEGKDITDLRSFVGGQGTINVPSWSPDSRRFAFVEYTRPS